MQRCKFQLDCTNVDGDKSGTVRDALKSAGANLVTVNSEVDLLRRISRTDRSSPVTIAPTDEATVNGEAGRMHGEKITPASLAEIFQAIAATQAKLRHVILTVVEQKPELPMYGTLGISIQNSKDIGAVAVEIMQKLEQLKLEIQSISVLSSAKEGEGYISCATQGFSTDTARRDVEENRDQVLTAIQDVLTRMNIVIPRDATKDIMTLIQ